ncbi:MAG TPA: hypothetical protein VNV65_02825 [Candidatus Solibacter sp.]|nr:hypothetical protein [Candidatus Solibacter sp.]
MPEVRLTFLDGEVLAAETELIDFSQPVVRARAADDSNNEELTIPLSSLKYIVMSGPEDEIEVGGGDLGKVVIHFTDGEALRAYAARDTLGGLYGVIYSLIEPQRKQQRRIGVPYTAVKAIFKVRQREGRGKSKPRAATGKPRATGAKSKGASVTSRAAGGGSKTASRKLKAKAGSTGTR